MKPWLAMAALGCALSIGAWAMPVNTAIASSVSVKSLGGDSELSARRRAKRSKVRTLRSYHRHVRSRGAPTSCLPQPIKDALARVAKACPGFRVTSTLRSGANISGTYRRSLHATCDAADFQVRNYACAYKALAAWRWGLSRDARRVAHIHISHPRRTGRNEGRFVHRGGRTRYAQRGYQRPSLSRYEYGGIRRDIPARHRVADATGRASWYGWSHAGRKTANGERFSPTAMTCAHRTLRFGTRVRVTNRSNGKSVICRVNDRGPAAWTGKIIDLSLGVFARIADTRRGVVAVTVAVLR